MTDVKSPDPAGLIMAGESLTTAKQALTVRAIAIWLLLLAGLTAAAFWGYSRYRRT